jgi:hypothetical protein
MTEHEALVLVREAEAAFNEAIKPLAGLIERHEVTRYNLTRTIEEVIEVHHANGVSVSPGDERPFVSPTKPDVVTAAQSCALALISAAQEAVARWPGRPILYAENWGISTKFAERKSDGSWWAFVDVRGYFLPADQWHKVPRPIASDAQQAEWDRQAKERGVPMVLAEALVRQQAGEIDDPRVSGALRRYLPIYSPRHPDHAAWKLGREAAKAEATSVFRALTGHPKKAGRATGYRLRQALAQ